MIAIEQANIAIRTGDLLEAKQRLRQLVTEQPFNATALGKLAQIATNEQRMDEATILFRRAANAEPNCHRHLMLLHHLHEVAGSAAALAEINRLPASIRQHVDIRSLEAVVRGMLGQHGRQIEILELLTKEAPCEPTVWVALGNALATSGRSDEAIACVRRAIEIDPASGEAYWTLANFKSFRFSDRDVAAMRKLLRRKLGTAAQIRLHFALGSAFENRGRFAQSYQHYAAGNDLQSAALKPEHVSVTAFVESAIATFDGELFERNRGNGCSAQDPIFVIGLHRSGSTLIEQILASHPLIEGTSELPVMEQIWRKLAQRAAQARVSPFAYLARMDTAAFNDVGAEYVERSRSYRRTERPMFVDKLPANWLHVGLIRLALPRATIIDARRHPLACGFSNFKQHYATGVGYAYSLSSIGRFYRDYLRSMRHFDEVQPGAILHISNERLISDTEPEIRRLLNHVGVPFDPVCLEAHRNKRAVRTPSADQVRRAINADGTNVWRAFEPWLDPLKQELGSALSDWVEGTD